MKFMLVSLVLIYSLVLSGCISKVEGIFVDTKKASPAYTTVGKINKNAPIIREPKKVVSIEEKLKKKKLIFKHKNEYEMVGYIVFVKREPEFDSLYLYTFVDALKTQKVQFYSKKRLPYPPTQLIRIYVKDNLLVEAKPYNSVNKKRVRSNIDVAKEYFIRF